MEDIKDGYPEPIYRNYEKQHKRVAWSCRRSRKMADQMLRNTREQFAEVKAQTASVMADAAKANREYSDCAAEINRYQKAAENALVSGNEGDAKNWLPANRNSKKNFPH